MINLKYYLLFILITIVDRKENNPVLYNYLLFDNENVSKRRLT